MAATYLGNPLTGGMVALPTMDVGMSNGFDRNDNVLNLIGGGVSVARAVKVRRTWQMLWTITTQAEANTVLGFYVGAWGLGPFAVVDSSWPNFLDLDQSLCGYRRGVVTGWTVPAGTTLLPSTAVAAAVTGAQVMAWTGAGSTSILAGGTQGTVTSFVGQGEPVTSSALPYVAGEPYTFSVWARAASGTPSVTARVSGRNAAGTVHTNASGTPTVLSSAGWTQITATAAAGTLGAQYVIPTVTCNTAASPVIYLSAPQLELASSASSWSFGMGSPRAVITSKLDTTVPVIGVRDITLDLAEVG